MFKSLKHIDAYLEEVRKDQIPQEALVQMVLRTGSYVGEVIRRSSSNDYNWLNFEEACKVSKLIEGLGMQLGTVAVLWSTPDNLCFPLAKILKYLENGSEDSTYSFAQIVSR